MFVTHDSLTCQVFTKITWFPFYCEGEPPTEQHLTSFGGLALSNDVKFASDNFKANYRYAKIMPILSIDNAMQGCKTAVIKIVNKLYLNQKA